jgi:hypothetical protein
MQQELAELRRLIGSRPSQTAVVQRNVTTPAPGDNKEVKIDDVATRAAEEQQHVAYMGTITHAFDTEVTDARWAPNAAASVRAALDSDEVLRNLAGSIDCRQQTCRVEIQDDGTQRMMKSLPLLANNVAATLPAVTAERIDNGNGRSTMVLYMSRLQQPQAPTERR